MKLTEHLQRIVKNLPVADHVYHYAQALVRATRPKEEGADEFCRKNLSFGAGPRASLALIMAAKAHAVLRGRSWVACEDVAAVAGSIMRHRLACNFLAQSEGITPDDVVTHLLQTIPQTEPLG